MNKTSINKISNVLKYNDKINYEIDKTDFEFNVLNKKIIIVKTNFEYCTWCKSFNSTCAVKFTFNKEHFERPVCDKCKIKFSLLMLRDKK